MSGLSPEMLDQMVRSGQLSPANTLRLGGGGFAGSAGSITPAAPSLPPVVADVGQRAAAADAALTPVISATASGNFDQKQRSKLIANAAQDIGEQVNLADPRMRGAGADGGAIAPAEVTAINPAKQATDEALATPQGRAQYEALFGLGTGSLDRAEKAIAGLVQRNIAAVNANTKAVRGVLNERSGLTRQQGQQARDQAGEEQRVIARQAQDAAAYEQQFTARRDKFLADFAAARDELSAMRTEYREAAQINPNRILSESVGNTILAVVLSSIGGAAASMTGGPNMALEAIQQAIKNDIQAQIAKRDGLANLLQDKREDIATLRQLYGDDLAVLDHALERKMFGAELKLREIATHYKGTGAEVAANLLANELEVKRLEQEAKNNALLFDASLQGLSAQASIAAQRAQIGVATLGAMAKVQESGRGRTIPGLAGGENADALDLKQVKESKLAHDKTVTAIRELMELRSKYGAEKVPGEIATRMRQLAQSIQFYKKDEYKLGVLSRDDARMLENIIGGDPGRIGFVMAQLEGLLGDTESNYRETLRTYGGFIPMEDLLLQDTVDMGGAR